METCSPLLGSTRRRGDSEGILGEEANIAREETRHLNSSCAQSRGNRVAAPIASSAALVTV